MRRIGRWIMKAIRSMRHTVACNYENDYYGDRVCVCERKPAER